MRTSSEIKKNNIRKANQVMESSHRKDRGSIASKFGLYEQCGSSAVTPLDTDGVYMGAPNGREPMNMISGDEMGMMDFDMGMDMMDDEMGMMGGGQVDCPKCGGEGCSHCDNKGSHGMDMMDDDDMPMSPEMVMKLMGEAITGGGKDCECGGNFPMGLKSSMGCGGGGCWSMSDNKREYDPKNPKKETKGGGMSNMKKQRELRERVNKKSLLSEAYFGILDYQGMNDFCNGCGACCGLTGVHYNFLGLPSGADLECMGCGSYAPGTTFDENGEPMGQATGAGFTPDDTTATNNTTTDKPNINTTKGLSGGKTHIPPKSSPNPKDGINEGYRGNKRLLKEAEMDCMSMSDAWACANFAIDCLNGGDIPYTNPSENTAQGYVTVYCNNGNSAVPPGAVSFGSAAEVEAYHAGFGGPLEADYEKTKSLDTVSAAVGGFGKGGGMMSGEKGNMGENYKALTATPSRDSWGNKYNNILTESNQVNGVNSLINRMKRVIK